MLKKQPIILEPSSGGIGKRLKTASEILIVAAYEKNVMIASSTILLPDLIPINIKIYENATLIPAIIILSEV